MITNIYIEQIPEIGDFITVDEWTSHDDNSYRGDCLEVLAVDKNLVRVVRHSGNHSLREWDKCTLNLDQVIIRELSDEFVSQFVD